MKARPAMILIGLGANLPTPGYAGPRETLEAALARLAEAGVLIEAVSPWYRTAPVPASDQPDYVNAVAAVATDLGPRRLLALLHAVEAAFGRRRGVRNAPRGIDLDLLVHGDLVVDTPTLAVPHPRLAQRAFVLMPLADLLARLGADWRHPASGADIATLLAGLPCDQRAERLAG
ncbi:MAG: 2-amino-4-hydroxy-6-hydroxymethyldihydropteridine diphosphokinase [Alphaproteobacteria bacterium]